MDIQTKIERIKTEMTFLIQGAGTPEEKQAALAEITQFTAEVQAQEAAKPAE